VREKCILAQSVLSVALPASSHLLQINTTAIVCVCVQLSVLVRVKLDTLYGMNVISRLESITLSFRIYFTLGNHNKRKDSSHVSDAMVK
jgi:hypothetical protein